MTASAPLQRSLVSSLTRALLAAVVLVWAVGTGVVAWYVNYKIQRNFDFELSESAHRQLFASPMYIPRPGEATPAVMHEAPDTVHDAPLLLQLRDLQGRVLVRTEAAPETGWTSELAEGFSDTSNYRIYTLYDPAKHLWLQLADTQEERREASRNTLTGLVLLLLLILPVLALIIRWVARRKLRSLGDIQEQIQARNGSHLDPLRTADYPLELAQVGMGVNLLLGRLQEALNVERSLAANAAHELRTPLASVRLRLHTAIDQAEATATSNVPLEEAKAALQALETLSHRTERLLQLSRAEAGDSASFAPVDLVQLAGTLAQEFWQQPRALKRLDWIAPEGHEPVWIQGDIDSLAIALRNLLDNALTHTSAAVELSVERSPMPALVVRDHGAGVPAAQLPHILERHVRADSRHVGYGLGMSIVSSIALKHGAQLELRSPLADGGTGLEVRLNFSPSTPR